MELMSPDCMECLLVNFTANQAMFFPVKISVLGLSPAIMEHFEVHNALKLQ